MQTEIDTYLVNDPEVTDSKIIDYISRIETMKINSMEIIISFQ
jgi:hypothetical protein